MKKLEIEELELLLGPEDSEVNLRYILTNASRTGSRIFDFFCTKEKSGHSVASKVRWDEHQRQRVAQEERARMDAQDADDDLCWTEACEGIAKKMLQKSRYKAKTGVGCDGSTRKFTCT